MARGHLATTFGSAGERLFGQSLKVIVLQAIREGLGVVSSAKPVGDFLLTCGEGATIITPVRPCR